MNNFIEELKEYGTKEKNPKMDGRFLVVILSPVDKK